MVLNIELKLIISYFGCSCFLLLAVLLHIFSHLLWLPKSHGRFIHVVNLIYPVIIQLVTNVLFSRYFLDYITICRFSFLGKFTLKFFLFLLAYNHQWVLATQLTISIKAYLEPHTSNILLRLFLNLQHTHPSTFSFDPHCSRFSTSFHSHIPWYTLFSFAAISIIPNPTISACDSLVLDINPSSCIGPNTFLNTFLSKILSSFIALQQLYIDYQVSVILLPNVDRYFFSFLCPHPFFPHSLLSSSLYYPIVYLIDHIILYQFPSLFIQTSFFSFV